MPHIIPNSTAFFSLFTLPCPASVGRGFLKNTQGEIHERTTPKPSLRRVGNDAPFLYPDFQRSNPRCSLMFQPQMFCPLFLNLKDLGRNISASPPSTDPTCPTFSPRSDLNLQPARALSNPILIQSFPFYRRIVEKSDPPRKGLPRRVCGGEALQGPGM